MGRTNYFGKTLSLTLVGVNGDIGIYQNGVYIDRFINTGVIKINQLFFQQGINNRQPDGDIFNCHIFAKALTQQEISARQPQLTEWFAEIPSVKIGTQEWSVRNAEMAVTPMGTVITNVTDGAEWADSTVVYDAKYASTAGTSAVKEYEACKEASMWSYYNNNPSIGAIYGKLYNWYAVKLLQLDIDAYNIANPNNKWGWRVPTTADFTTLSTFLGGNAVSGGKLKHVEVKYWRQPNPGATNETGFSAIASGYRDETGSTLGIQDWSIFWSIDKSRFFIRHVGAESGTSPMYPENYGVSLRLIKDNS